MITAILFVLQLQAAAANAYLGGGSGITVPLGETQQHHLTIYNPHDTREAFNVQISTYMNNGNLAARISQDIGEPAGRLEVGARTNRTLPVSYTAAHCQNSQCNGQATVTVQSLRTGQVHSDTVPVTIKRPAPMRGAPGITGLQLVVISALAGLTVFLTSQRAVDDQ